MIEEFLNRYGYLLFSGLLLVVSFFVLHFGNQKNARKSANEMNKTIDSIVEKATNKTISSLEISTAKLKKEVDSAVSQITAATTGLSEELGQLQNITKSIENSILYSQILVKVKYSFTDVNVDNWAVGGQMVKLFSSNKFFLFEFVSSSKIIKYKSNTENEFFWVSP